MYFLYISGAIVATLIVISIIDENIVLYVNTFDDNLLWFMGIFTATFTASRTMIPKYLYTNINNNNNLNLDNNNNIIIITNTKSKPKSLIDIISAYTHHKPNQIIGIIKNIQYMFIMRLMVYFHINYKYFYS